MESLRGKTVKGIIWSSIERFSMQGIQVLVTLVIARILMPRDYGLVGMLTIFIAVAQSLVDSGFSQALIRKQDRSNVDNSTVFYFNIVVSCGLYFLIFFAAPFVASFYNEPQLCSLMRVLCLVIIINSFAVVQRAIYTAIIDFETQAKATFTSAIVSGIVGIYLALNGFGVWALVWQQIVKSSINTFLLWWYSTWFPDKIYSWDSFHNLFSFGSKLLLSGLINTIYNNIYQIFIGKFFSATSLGFFSQAKQIAALPSSNIHGIIGSVTYPVLSSIQDDDERLAINYRKLLRVSAFIIFPLMCGLAGVADPLVFIFLGNKWTYVAGLLVPVCFAMMWYPVHAINLNLLKVKGRSDLFLRLEIIKKLLGITVLVITIPFGMLVMCYGLILNSIIALAINTYYTGKLINVGFIKQIKDLSGTLLLSLSMFGLVFISIHMITNPYIQFSFGLVLGAFYFVAVCYIVRLDEFNYIKSVFKEWKKTLDH